MRRERGRPAGNIRGAVRVSANEPRTTKPPVAFRGRLMLASRAAIGVWTMLRRGLRDVFQE